MTSTAGEINENVRVCESNENTESNTDNNVVENAEIKAIAENSRATASNSDSATADINNNADKDKVSIEEKATKWAYDVLEWLGIAICERAYDRIYEHLEEIIQAFLILVKPEHRGIVLDLLRKVSKCV